MSDINWKENVVCYASGEYWFPHTLTLLMNNVKSDEATNSILPAFALENSDFQLNQIREGDFIPASELNTEQKYNDVVEVFALFGFRVPRNKNYFSIKDCEVFKTFCDYVVPDVLLTAGCKRQLTYHQIIAIGKLKRMMLEREKYGAISGADLTADNADQVKNPKHYQLIEGVESIEIIARSMTKEQWKGFCLGNMLKYRIRAGKKDALQQDIEKANFYGDLYEMHKEKCYD